MPPARRSDRGGRSLAVVTAALIVTWVGQARGEPLPTYPWLDESGSTMGRAVVRPPLEGARLSSPFDERRVHPVLGRRLPHLGVDLAAPRGTPVRAVERGVVALTGRSNREGLHVTLRHPRQWESTYWHLARWASGTRPGARVRAGEVIGFVGSTGLATGPHLHFGLLVRGRFVDPFRWRGEAGGARGAAEERRGSPRGGRPAHPVR